MGIEIIYKLAGIGLITAIISLLLKRSGKDEISTLVSVAGLIICVLLVMDMVVQLFDSLQSLFGY